VEALDERVFVLRVPVLHVDEYTPAGYDAR